MTIALTIFLLIYAVPACIVMTLFIKDFFCGYDDPTISEIATSALIPAINIFIAYLVVVIFWIEFSRHGDSQ